MFAFRRVRQMTRLLDEVRNLRIIGFEIPFSFENFARGSRDEALPVFFWSRETESVTMAPFAGLDTHGLGLSVNNNGIVYHQ